MSAYFFNRRNFLQAGIGAASALLLPHSAWGLIPEDDRTAWFRDVKFGMFIHWGPYSLASVEASWPIMVPKPGGITQAEYTSLWKRFNPTKYDPNAWIDLARTAGQQYMVFTTKHHDGFCMFDSDYTDYKITNTPYGKDVVKQLADACDARGMRLGLYYSPPDMHNPNFRDTSKPVSENWHGEPNRSQWPLYLDYMQLQLTELLTRYGPVALIWFDGLNNQEKYDGERFIRLIHRLQPATLVNDRIGVPGDYVTPEQFVPAEIPTKNARFHAVDRNVNQELKPGVPAPQDFQLWETCMTINNTWAYNEHDHNYKSSRFLIRSLVEVASRGGNFLLNVGPRPDGTIQPEFQERLKAIGNWMAVHGDAIYGTTYGPVQDVKAIRTTAKRDTVYVHVFDWPAKTLIVPGLTRKVISARLMSTEQALSFRQTESNLEVDVSACTPDENVSVIALRLL
jgi:alpha-L-fucosidase